MTCVLATNSNEPNVMFSHTYPWLALKKIDWVLKQLVGIIANELEHTMSYNMYKDYLQKTFHFCNPPPSSPP